jgi:hypothetical protein
MNLWLNDGRDRLQQLYYRCRTIDVCCGLQCCPPATQVLTTVVITSTSVTENNGGAVQSATAQSSPPIWVDNSSVLYQNNNYYINDDDAVGRSPTVAVVDMLILQNKNGLNSNLCNYTITEEDGELSKLHKFWKGDGQERVEQLYYKCALAEVCCNLMCCSEDTEAVTNTTKTFHRDENGTLILEHTSNTTTLIEQIDQ